MSLIVTTWYFLSGPPLNRFWLGSSTLGVKVVLPEGHGFRSSNCKFPFLARSWNKMFSVSAPLLSLRTLIRKKELCSAA